MQGSPPDPSLLQQFVEHATEVFFRIRVPEGTYEYISPAVETMCGYTQQECYATPFLVQKVMPPHWQQVFAQSWGELMQGRIPPFVEFPIVTKTGELRWMHQRNWVVWNDSRERVVALDGLVIDVTDSKRAEEAMRQSEQRYRTTIDAIGDLLHVVDAELRLVLMNDAGVRWLEELGLPVGEPLGKQIFEVFPFLPPHVREQYESVFQTGKPVITEEKSSIGRALFVTETRKIPIVEDDKVVRVITVVRDVTERALTQERLRQAEKMEALGHLAGGIAHDFNNQLAAILGFAELLRRAVTEPGQQDAAEMIVRAASRSAELTRQLLAFARKGIARSQTVDIHAIIAEVAALLGRTIDKRIRIRTELAEHRCCTTGDAGQLYAALLNLAINARDAMPEGGELVFGTSRVTLDEEQCRTSLQRLSPGPHLKITVSDTGVGMDEATRRRLFEPFFTTKEPGAGTGMGLAGVYGTVVNHKGAIQVRTEVRQGSTFTMLLPAIEAAEVQAGSSSAAPQPVPSRHVLVVDDEPSVRELIAIALREFGFRVTSFDDSRAAVAWYREHGASVDLVILDMAMPHLDGGETLSLLKTLNPGLKAIVASGHVVDSSASLQAGACGFLQKPFHIDDLYQTVARVLPASPAA
jgi:PAS domain S-box-containing protein